MRITVLTLPAIALSTAALLTAAVSASAASAPFLLSIDGENIALRKSLVLSDVGEGKTAINFDFRDDAGAGYNFDLKYRALPDNRSYPTNLDITIKNADGEKLGYLFWANNGVSALQRIGVFGLIIDVDGNPLDIRFEFERDQSQSKKTLRVSELGQERLVQDTLIGKFGFQMIRPVLLPEVSKGYRSQSFKLDSHPYVVNYTLKDLEGEQVEFQFNFYSTSAEKNHLLERIYYHADSIETLREGMFAGKYFDKQAGAVKLVYYPALGQTQPKPQEPK